MVRLVDIPLVMPLAEWIWAGALSDDVSAETCLSQVPFLTSGCFSQLLSKALGVAIVLGSCLNKMPIILNMMKTRSAIGVSRTGLYGEAVVYTNCALYGFLQGHPINAYGENVSLLMQNVALIVMAWQFKSSTVAIQEKAVATVFFVVYVICGMYVLPPDLRYLLMSSTWITMLYARGSQVIETFYDKHTGNLSIVTTSMNLVGASIRILTTLNETGDMVVVSGYLLSVVMCLIMFIQYWMYLEKTLEVQKQAQAELKKTKETTTKKED